MVRIVLVTVPDAETAKKIARALVEERLAACVNLVPGLTSVYRWEGEVHEDAELLLVIKTTDDALKGLEERVRALHPYSVPEILAIEVDRGFERYLAWVKENVK